MTAFLGVFVAVGWGLAFQAYQEGQAGSGSLSWPTADATVVASEVGETDRGWQPHVVYSYVHEGEQFVSERYSFGKDDRYSVSEALRIPHAYPVGAMVSCYVDPQDAEQAVLHGGHGKVNYPQIMFGSIFGGIPFLILLGVWGSLLSGGGSQEESGSGQGSSQGGGRCAGACFSGIFFLIGAGVFVGLFLYPMYEAHQAQAWMEVPCVVQRAEVQSHRSDDSTTYSIKVLYRYELDGMEYLSEDYGFDVGSSSSRGWRDEAVARLKAKPERTCYVDPADHYRAVLDREGGHDVVFAFIPLIFVLVGGVGLMASLRGGGASSQPGPGERLVPTRSEPEPEPEPRSRAPRRATRGALVRKAAGAARKAPRRQGVRDSQTLDSQSSPKAAFIAVSVFCLFWNGIVGTGAVSSVRDGSGFVICFLLPFIAIGIGLIVGVVYTFLALFNPKISVRLDPGSPALGEHAELVFSVEGDAKRFQAFSVRLEGEERATYRRGTNTTTATNTFFRQTLYQRSSCPTSDSVEFTLPALSVPTFKAPRNEIRWQIVVHGDIPNWPDVNETYPIDVVPGGHEPLPEGEPLVQSEGPLRIELPAGARYAPGEELRGLVAWDLPSTPGMVQVALGWETSGRGDSNSEVVLVEDLAARDRSEEQPFRLVLPEEPYSFSGQLITLTWTLELRTGGGERVTTEITIAPEGQELELPEEDEQDKPPKAAFKIEPSS